MHNEEAAVPFISEILKDAIVREIEPSASTSKQEAAHERYGHYYNRIYPVLKELDFQKIANKTGFKERRVRETLLFRLGSGEVLQLFGKQDGFCYICGCKNRTVTKEPVCLKCLETLDTTIQQMYPGNTEFQAIPYNETGWGTVLPEPLTMPENSPPDVVLRSEHEAVLAQLRQYQTKYGPLEPVINTAAEKPAEGILLDINPEALLETLEQPPNELETQAPPIEDQTDSLLVLLAMDDRDVPSDSVLLPEALSNEALRHFGFQRLKGTG